MSSLAAFLATMKFMNKNKVISKNWMYGKKLKQIFNYEAKKLNIEKFIYMAGINCSPYYVCKDKFGKISLKFRTLFMQEMIKSGVLFTNYLSISYSHKNKELYITKKAIQKSLLIYKKALTNGIEKYLFGSTIRPVFRKYN